MIVMDGLSPRQRDVLDFIREFMNKHGLPPTVREIGAGLSVSAPRCIFDHLKALERKGFIRRRSSRARDLEIIGESDGKAYLPASLPSKSPGRTEDQLRIAKVFTKRGQLAMKMRLDGYTYREIGEHLRISQQRVQQILSPPTAVYRYVAERAKHACELCGVKCGNGQVHHKQSTGITPEQYQDIDNLQHLCWPCHRKAHNQRRTER